jgi:hypothetical protein
VIEHHPDCPLAYLWGIPVSLSHDSNPLKKRSLRQGRGDSSEDIDSAPWYPDFGIIDVDVLASKLSESGSPDYLKLGRQFESLIGEIVQSPALSLNDAMVDTLVRLASPVDFDLPP